MGLSNERGSAVPTGVSALSNKTMGRYEWGERVGTDRPGKEAWEQISFQFADSSVNMNELFCLSKILEVKRGSLALDENVCHWTS